VDAKTIEYVKAPYAPKASQWSAVALRELHSMPMQVRRGVELNAADIQPQSPGAPHRRWWWVGDRVPTHRRAGCGETHRMEKALAYMGCRPIRRSAPSPSTRSSSLLHHSASRISAPPPPWPGAQGSRQLKLAMVVPAPAWKKQAEEEGSTRFWSRPVLSGANRLLHVLAMNADRWSRVSVALDIEPQLRRRQDRARTIL